MLRFRPFLWTLLWAPATIALLASAQTYAQEPTEAVDPCAGRGFSTLEMAAREMERAAVELDVPAFESAWTQVQADLPCVPSVLTPRQAATIHKAYALGAFTNKQLDETRWSYTAMLDVLPNYELPDSLAPGSTHPLDRLLDDARTADSGVPRAVELPRGTSLYLDGKAQAQRPSNRAAIAQVYTDDGALLWAGYVYPNSTFPPPNMPTPPKSDQERVARISFVSAGALAGLAVGTGIGTAYLVQQRRDSADQIRLGAGPTSLDELNRYDQQATRSNLLIVTAQTSAVLALGLTGFGLVVLW
ncbi:hypothetical protein L6R46_13610 [Myxococcota bacterium]|nr:hypothetical protein [Myxococcota bacterium]